MGLLNRSIYNSCHLWAKLMLSNGKTHLLCELKEKIVETVQNMSFLAPNRLKAVLYTECPEVASVCLSK